MLFSVIQTVWGAYDNISTIRKIWESFGVAKDYFSLRLKNPEVYIGLEKIYFVQSPLKDSMEKLTHKLLTGAKLQNGLKFIKDGCEFESADSHINYSIQTKVLEVGHDKQIILVLKTDTKLYYPFRKKAILKKLQEDFYLFSEIVASVYTFTKSNEVIKMELNVKNVEQDSKYSWKIHNVEVIYKNKKLQINNSSHGKDNYELIISSIVLWYLRFNEAKFVKTTQRIEE